MTTRQGKIPPGNPHLWKLRKTDSASSCAMRGGHVLCSKPWVGMRYQAWDLQKEGPESTCIKQKTIGHHARPTRALATAPIHTGADTCKTGSGAGKRSGAKSDPVRRRSNHAWTEDQAGRRKRATIDAVGGWRVHTADDALSRNAATRSKHCNFMCQGDIRPRAAAG